MGQRGRQQPRDWPQARLFLGPMTPARQDWGLPSLVGLARWMIFVFLERVDAQI